MRLTCSGLVIGEAPLSAKAQAGHGAILNWCDVIVGFTPRRAQCYLDAALLFRRHGDVVGLLPPTAAQDLGASSVGEDTVGEVLAHVRRGERVTLDWSRQRSDATRAALAGRNRYHSREIAAMMMKALDVRDCLRMQVFLDTRPSARLFMADFVDYAATKIGSSRNPRVRRETLALTVGQWFWGEVVRALGARRDLIIPVWH